MGPLIRYGVQGTLYIVATTNRLFLLGPYDRLDLDNDFVSATTRVVH